MWYEVAPPTSLLNHVARGVKSGYQRFARGSICGFECPLAPGCQVQHSVGQDTCDSPTRMLFMAIRVTPQTPPGKTRGSLAVVGRHCRASV